MKIAVLALAAALGAIPLAGLARSASPPASPSAAPSGAVAPSVAPKSAAKPTSARPTATEVHRAIVICDREPFYVWPDRSSAPHVSSYSPAVRDESFEVIGDGTLAYGQVTLYETTIDAFAPYGGGNDSQHYWIRAACVNAG